MPTITSSKVRGFLASPRIYPRGGLGFGQGAGAISASKATGPHTTNHLPSGRTPEKITPVSVNKAREKVTANFNIKTAEDKGMKMFDKIKEVAMIKCAGDEQKAEEFLQAFYETLLEKEAGFADGLTSTLVRDFAGGISKGLAGVTLGLGVSALTSAIKSTATSQLHNQFTTALSSAIATNPVLRQAKKEKVVNYAETIFKFAPHVATDANLLSSILANAVHGEGIDPQTIKTLTDLESRYAEVRSPSSFSPKAYV